MIKPPLSDPYKPWLIDNASLTMRLQCHYRDFYVQPLSVQYAKPIQDEAALLHVPINKIALIRDVLLFGKNMPVVFAHSVLPRKCLRGQWQDLGRLGNQPLGATLFANPKVKRTPLRYKKLSSNHVLYQQAVKYLASKPAYLWARRSIFSLNRANIMVTEVFLPSIAI